MNAVRRQWLHRATRIVRDAGRWRLATTLIVLIVALFCARFSWEYVPVVGDAERTLYDLRMTHFAPRVDQDPRVVLIVYNDQTLIATKKRSPLDRATLARALRTIDGLGAKSIGIDILIDQPQDEDAELIATLRAMKTPTYLGYAEVADNAEQIIYEQQQFLDAFIARARTARVKPASIRLEADADNVARSWPAQLPSLPTILVQAMAPSPAFERYRGSIRYRLPADPDRPVFASFPIDLFTDPATGAAFVDQVRGRHVMIGGDIVDNDQFETPMSTTSGKSMIGLEVHANMLAQSLDGAALRPVPAAILWAVAILAVLSAAFTSLAELRWYALAPCLLVQALLLGGLPLWWQSSGWDTQGVPAIGWAIGWVLAFAAVGSAARAVGSQQRRFAQSALGKYLPRDIATQILQEPEKLALHGEKRSIFVVFTDLEGFTKLSHGIAPEMVAQLLNGYLDMLSDVVLAHGGTIDKFVGDAVVAFWGAPIARPDDGTKAAQAAYAMWQTGEAFRIGVAEKYPDGSVPPIGKTRVGLHYGEAIVGNFGGEGRIQYTALGDSMNTAARLESANKALQSSMMASREAVERAGLDWWRPMGTVVLRGRAKPVDIFEPAPDFPASDRDHLSAILNRLKTDRAGALVDLAALLARYPQDNALAHLYYRIEQTKDGDVYAVG
ncbi:adenylate/guanylate cyclase domain-containing protein [Sphingobium algorifonticola]|uniref:Adenylate/guanylate cyclase domain-containing protein n=1 Tax=Sphingobium algorifonticola TaxID=2008318 RepID=A0A437JCJ0_9SPHN|nr:adenylate/guanylate cyclase domain-containing protein [Sphingobium algorifonticola]RVT43607.1 adenylate/guanylate cyclase domain-containing protein [Sphingobium algorifonticola]